MSLLKEKQALLCTRPTTTYYMEDHFLHERLHSNYPLDCLPRPFAMAASKREKPIQCGKLTFNLPSQKTSSIFFFLPPNHRLVHLPGDTCTFFAGLILVETWGNSFLCRLNCKNMFYQTQTYGISKNKPLHLAQWRSFRAVSL